MELMYPLKEIESINKIEYWNIIRKDADTLVFKSPAISFLPLPCIMVNQIKSQIINIAQLPYVP